MYINFDTGEPWEEQELKQEYESLYELHEEWSTFEEYVEHLLDLGRQGVGGIVLSDGR